MEEKLTWSTLVKQLIKQYQWKLLTEGELIGQVILHLETDLSPTQMKTHVVITYWVALYEGCRPTAKPAQQEQAYKEVFHYLHNLGLKEMKDEAKAEEIAQAALIHVFEKFERCQAPQVFRPFVIWMYRWAKKDYFRKLPQEDNLPLTTTTLELATFDMNELMNEEQLTYLFEAIKRLKREPMRQAIVLKFFEGLDDDEIAQQLGTTRGNVRALRCRGIKQLREDTILMAYFYFNEDEE